MIDVIVITKNAGDRPSVGVEETVLIMTTLSNPVFPALS